MKYGPRTRGKMRAMFAMLGAACVCASSAVYAAAIGAPERTARLGIGVGYERAALDDPDGATDTASAVQPWNVFYNDRLSGAARYWLHGYYRRAVLPASASVIGQDAESLGLAASWQTRVAHSEAWDCFAGGGMYAARSSYKNRHNKDSDGFRIAADYAVERSRVELGMQVNAVAETQLSPSWDFASEIHYAAPFGDGMSDAGVMLIFLYTGR